MNRILQEIRTIIHETMDAHFPHMKNSDLEKDGAIFYMNGNNGTEFDWYVNDKLPPFMVFYNDEENLGAVKLTLHSDGGVEVYLYDQQGRHLLNTVCTKINADEKELLKLAALLRREADDRAHWDADIEDIHTDLELHDDALDEFKRWEPHYAATKNRKKILSQTACVSKKITEECWKVGYMERMEPHHEEDSGWFFASGTEDDDYFSDCQHMELVPVGAVWQQLDSDIFQYLDLPIGTRLIRISEEAFEADRNDREICTVKR